MTGYLATIAVWGLVWLAAYVLARMFGVSHDVAGRVAFVGFTLSASVSLAIRQSRNRRRRESDEWARKWQR